MKLVIGIDGDSYEVEVEVIEDDEATHHPPYGTQPMVPSTWQSTAAPAVRAQTPSPEQNGDEDKLCRSPMNGIVIRANVEPGQIVAENELLMVLEAMKMETNVTARHSGKVKTVRVAAGESVKLNQVIVELE